ncbi:collagen-like protein [Pseudomonas sp. MMS21-TM103]|uniref:collagen-like protein n=1 Tax=unclassified Pseudomonas TaxID=196821 RepID=UPI001EDF933E|nr:MULTISPECIES: collagen-like protein [unclassified Pseudomonas]MCG4455021.1 collagen-like protein [Pseudomonas sp. MMS21 TM103]
MRSLLLLAALCSPLALAQSLIEVQSHTMLRLPATTHVLQVERLHIADHGTLLIPSGLTDMHVAELRLGRDARIAIAPGEQPFRLDVGSGEVAAGAQISVRGAPGSFLQPALPGRTLSLRLVGVVTEALLVDARGGMGAPGYSGLDGADGKPGGCAWGQASRGHDGLRGGDGQAGARGGQVRLEVPLDFPLERLQVRLDGGAGGSAGNGGNAGAGGASKGCWLYSTSHARDGRSGQSGQSGIAGAAGNLDVVRF